MKRDFDPEVGDKFDDGKPKIHLVPTDFLRVLALDLEAEDPVPDLTLLPDKVIVQIAKVFEYGVKKYARDNWKKGLSEERIWDAVMRHLLKYRDGYDTDTESGLPHLSHAACGIIFLMYERNGKIESETSEDV